MTLTTSDSVQLHRFPESMPTLRPPARPVLASLTGSPSPPESLAMMMLSRAMHEACNWSHRVHRADAGTPACPSLRAASEALPPEIGCGYPS